MPSSKVHVRLSPQVPVTAFFFGVDADCEGVLPLTAAVSLLSSGLSPLSFDSAGSFSSDPEVSVICVSPDSAGSCFSVSFDSCFSVSFGSCFSVSFGSCFSVSFGSCFSVSFGVCFSVALGSLVSTVSVFCVSEGADVSSAITSIDGIIMDMLITIDNITAVILLRFIV